MVIKEDGNVGIGTANPTTAGLVASKAVSGVTIDATTGRIINVGSPALASDAATKSYVDTALTSTPVVVASTTGAYVLRSGDTMTGNLNMAGKNINAVNKAYITTIDPLYQIGGANYATYVPSFAGGVKEEYTGRGVFRNNQSLLINDYTFAIDFANMEKGSDLWVWRHAVEFGPETVEAVATPYGGFAQIYYTIAGNTLTFHGNAPVAFSFRLTGKRFDWREWPTKADDSLPANLIVK
jgi:hypothetical protein